MEQELHQLDPQQESNEYKHQETSHRSSLLPREDIGEEDQTGNRHNSDG